MTSIPFFSSIVFYTLRLYFTFLFTLVSSFSTMLRNFFTSARRSFFTSLGACALSSSAPFSVFKIGRLNHVAIAVPSLEAAVKSYETTFGAEVTAPHSLPEHGVTVSFVRLQNTNIELLQPLGEKSPVAGFIEKNKLGGIHHICLEVDDIHQAVEVCKKNGVRCLGKEPKIGAHGKPVMFLHPKDCNGVLIELEQCHA
uniref:Methylmalonyl-CoA epimerase, mitochondrial n=1 Tax=Stygiella incarcerata TaxID=1712417 RepID=A0A192ZIR4_9EUKA|nr:methylmalonyl CoA epimerase [Stygiella incarcerata]